MGMSVIPALRKLNQEDQEEGKDGRRSGKTMNVTG
jgi:hypothetical protein